MKWSTNDRLVGRTWRSRGGWCVSCDPSETHEFHTAQGTWTRTLTTWLPRDNEPPLGYSYVCLSFVYASMRLLCCAVCSVESWTLNCAWHASVKQRTSEDGSTARRRAAIHRSAGLFTRYVHTGSLARSHNRRTARSFVASMANQQGQPAEMAAQPMNFSSQPTK